MFYFYMRIFLLGWAPGPPTLFKILLHHHLCDACSVKERYLEVSF